MLTPATEEWIKQHGFDKDNINCPGKYQDTPLILACRRGQTNIADELIEAGADVNQSNMDGTTALWACVVSNSFATADKLLAAGADLDHKNDNGATTLMYASSAGKTPWVEYFLEKGADTQVKSLDDFTALDLASKMECLKLLKRAIARELESSPA